MVFWSVKYRECSELLYRKKFPLKVTGTVYKNYVITAVLQRSEAWCLRENVIEVLGIQRSIVRVMCGLQHNDRKRVMPLMLMLGCNDAIDQLATNSEHWYGNV